MSKGDRDEFSGGGGMSEYVLSEIAEVIDCEHKTAPQVDRSKYYSIRTTDIFNGKIKFESANRVSEETYVEWIKRATPEPEDIILAREAPVGEVGWIKDGYKVCLGQRTVLIKVTHNEVSKRFLLYYLVNPDTKYQLQVRSAGSVVEHLNMKDIRCFKLSLPPLPEQKVIASILSSLDDKIDLLHRQNRTLEAIAETLFRQWFIEEAQEDWEFVELGTYVNCFNGVSYKSSDLNPSTTAMVTLKSFERDGGFRLDGFKEFTGKYKEQHFVTQGDLVVAHTDITQDAAVIGNPVLVVSHPAYDKLVM
jgi:type I restriction enzyme, S subunit